MVKMWRFRCKGSKHEFNSVSHWKLRTWGYKIRHVWLTGYSFVLQFVFLYVATREELNWFSLRAGTHYKAASATQRLLQQHFSNEYVLSFVAVRREARCDPSGCRYSWTFVNFVKVYVIRGCSNRCVARCSVVVSTRPKISYWTFSL
jgi:hypothetical protein